jgi:hypothetical protein
LSPLFLFFLLAFPASPAQSAPSLWLPTPIGERWEVAQGYGCGTHNSWDRFALDLVSADGKTYGAPVRAAADGTVFVWEPKSGTLILRHGDGFYTQYTHLASAAVTARDRAVQRGQVIGTVGDRGTKGNPHLHFHAFTANGSWASNRQTVPLSFAEGYDLPPLKGCNQHFGEVLVAGDRAGMAIEEISFSSEAQPGRWYNRDIAVTFGGSALSRGFSAAWANDPGGEHPAHGADSPGVAQIAALGEGLHTLHVRGWNTNGEQTLATYGPIGYDITAPQAVPSPEQQTISANTQAPIRWPVATDNASGVAGYRVYIGPDANGTSEWYVQAPEATTEGLAAGSYVLRVQPIDFAGNSGAWTAVGQVVVE